MKLVTKNVFLSCNLGWNTTQYSKAPSKNSHANIYFHSRYSTLLRFFLLLYVAFADLFILVFSHLEGILHRNLSHGTGGFPKGCRTCRGQFEEKRKPTSSRSSLLFRFASCKPVIHYELLLDAERITKKGPSICLWMPDGRWKALQRLWVLTRSIKRWEENYITHGCVKPPRSNIYRTF